MARSVLTVWNMSLAYLGVRSKIEHPEELTREADQLRAISDVARDAALESDGFPWNFLTKYRALAPLEQDTPESWEYVYQKPADCLVMRYIEGAARTDADPISFEMGIGTDGEQVIFTDQDDAVACYSERVEDPARWSAQFCEALAWKLAATLAMTERGTPRKATELEKIYLVELEKAKVLSANEDQRDAMRDAEGIRARQ